MLLHAYVTKLHSVLTSQQSKTWGPQGGAAMQLEYKARNATLTAQVQCSFAAMHRICHAEASVNSIDDNGLACLLSCTIAMTIRQNIKAVFANKVFQ